VRLVGARPIPARTSSVANFHLHFRLPHVGRKKSPFNHSRGISGEKPLTITVEAWTGTKDPQNCHHSGRPFKFEICFSLLPNATSGIQLLSASFHHFPKPHVTGITTSRPSSRKQEKKLLPGPSMSAGRPLRGGCQCGRNQYVVVVPSDATEAAQVLFDAHSSRRESFSSCPQVTLFMAIRPAAHILLDYRPKSPSSVAPARTSFSPLHLRRAD
jgi:hypothetical protein